MSQDANTDPQTLPPITEPELLRVVQAIRDGLKGDFTTARKWFWTAMGAALGAALTAGIGQIVSLVIAKHFH